MKPRIEAAIRLLYPDEMTPIARNMLMRILEDEAPTPATRQKFYGWGEQKVSF